MDTSPEEMQMLIDERLLSLERQSLELMTQRNTYAHISKLPNELLLEVFMIIVATSRSIRGWYSAVNSVCHHWRAVALNSPALWAEPPTQNHDLTRLMLGRSKAIDLEIFLDSGTSPRTTAAIMENVERITLLHITQPFERLEKTHDALLSSRAPSRLQYLTISVPPRSRTPTFHLSPSIMLGLERLRYLHLSCVVMDWNAIHGLRNLQHLALENIALVDPISYQTLLDALDQMSKLQEISLSLSTTLVNQPTLSYVGKPICLPSLYHLTLHYTLPEQLHSFLTHTEYPILRCAYIKCDDPWNYDDGDYHTTAQALLRLLEGGGFGRPFRSLELHAASLTAAHDEDTWPEFELHLPNFPYSEESSQVRVEDLRFISRIGAEFIQAVNLSTSLTRAEITRHHNALELIHLMGRLPNLKAITISQQLLDDLTAALTITPDLQPTQPLPFPRLQSISWRDQIRAKNRHALEEFLECLMMRHEYGLSIHDMTLDPFTGCGVVREQLLQIVPIVVYADDRLTDM